MNKIYIDFETRSRVDIKKHGAWVYSKDPSTDVLCLGAWFPADFEPTVIPQAELNNDVWRTLIYDFHRTDTVFVAHNAFFELVIWNHVLVPKYGFPPLTPERFVCTASRAAACGLPKSLEKCSEALFGKTGKDMSGSRTMLKLAKPRRSGAFYEPEDDANQGDFQKLYDYCAQDVTETKKIDEALPQLSEQERKVWCLDQEINLRGVKVDVENAKRAINFIDGYAEVLNNELSEITGGRVTTAGQVARIIKWCEGEGKNLPDLTAQTVKSVLADRTTTGDIRRVLEIRKTISKSSNRKLQKLIDSADPADHRIRDNFSYHSASTGRWGGKGLQLQNLPRGNLAKPELVIDILNSKQDLGFFYEDPMSAISSAIRSFIQADTGKVFLQADFASIETRVLFWLAGEKHGLDMYKAGEDLYVDMASAISKDATRQLGKQVILGCGYGMGVNAFIQTCEGYGMEEFQNIPWKQEKTIVDGEIVLRRTYDSSHPGTQLAQKAVYAYREKYNSVCAMWKGIEKAALACCLTRTTVTGAGKWPHWWLEDRFLVCLLPSGRKLRYFRPELKEGKLRYWTMNSMTRKLERTATWGGKLVENIVQAVARDLLAEAMLRMSRCENIVLHVHDEMVVEVPEDWANLNRFKDIMSAVPEWAKGLPIEVEGWKGERYKK